MIVVDGHTAGGLLVFRNAADAYYLCQVFLEPALHGRGVGARAMELMFARYPQARTWTTDTPAWNRRTRPFYEKLGFRVVKDEDGLLHFEKRME